MDQRLNFKIDGKVPQGAGGRRVGTRVMCVRKGPSTERQRRWPRRPEPGPPARAQPRRLGPAALSPPWASVLGPCARRSRSASCPPQVAAINPNHPLAQVPLPPSMKNCIQLAACEASELLPMIPDLPADLFTSCLTTPIKTALRW